MLRRRCRWGSRAPCGFSRNRPLARFASRSRIPAPASTNPTARASLTRCSPPRQAAWEWGFRSAARSSRTTAEKSGRSRGQFEGLFSSSSCRLLNVLVHRKRLRLSTAVKAANCPQWVICHKISARENRSMSASLRKRLNCCMPRNVAKGRYRTWRPSPEPSCRRHAAGPLSSLALLFDPRLYALARHTNWQMSFRQNHVVEGAQIKARAQALLGLGPQFEDRKLASLVAEGLRGPRHVTKHFSGRETLGLATFVEEEPNRLRMRPTLGVNAGVNH